MYIAAYDLKLNEIEDLESELLDYQATIERRELQAVTLRKEDYTKQ